MNTTTEKQLAHQLLDQLDPGQLTAVVHLLEVMLTPSVSANASVTPENEEISEEEERAVADAKEWLSRNGGKGIPHEEVLADFGLTMDDFLKMGERRAARRR